MRSLLVVIMVVAMVMSGCVSWTSTEVDTYVLRFTLENVSGESAEANPGPHCSTARFEGDRLEVEASALNRTRAAETPVLIVVPSLEGNWATLGTGSYPAVLPVDVETGIPDESQFVGNISWDPDENRALVDGQAVELPHEWTTTAEDGSWRAVASLEEGPSKLHTFRMGECM